MKPPRAAKDFTSSAKDALCCASDKAREALCSAKDKAKDVYHSAAVKAEDTLSVSKDYVRRNPVSAVLGAVLLGAAVGYMIMSARRKQTFGERYVNEPMNSTRKAILSAFAPVAHRVRDGYVSACEGAGKAKDRIHHFKPRSAVDSLSDQIGRVSSNLKFW